MLHYSNPMLPFATWEAQNPELAAKIRKQQEDEAKRRNKLKGKGKSSGQPPRPPGRGDQKGQSKKPNSDKSSARKGKKRPNP